MKPASPLESLVRYSLSGGLPLMLLLLSLGLGALALTFTPREEEPQIVVPMVDVLVEAPGLSASQVERQVTIPLEKLLAQIPGVENVYSTTMTGRTTATLRFYVGEDRETSLLNTYNKLYSNQQRVPAVVSRWQVSPVEVDDVPILLLALWSSDPDRTSDYELRRVADEVSTFLQSVPDTSEVNVVGGRPRTIRILPDPESLAARASTVGDILNALQVSNQLLSGGNWTLGNESLQLESGDFIRSVDELRQSVINVVDGQPVLLREVAEIVDGPAEPDSYTWIDFAEPPPVGNERNVVGNERNEGHVGGQGLPMVTLSVAKQRGSNAVSMAKDIHTMMARLQTEFLPSDIHLEVIRDYGATANEKVNNLAQSLGFAVFTVVVFIAVFLGWRPAVVVGVAVPISYGVTLALDMAFGYTINRVTLFALILSLGLLVDDPITGVDNIERFMRERGGSLKEKIVAAISEIRTPLVMSTLTIVLAFIPLAFITGMMGPYMAPMAFNVPVSVITSTVVAFVVTPWLAMKLLSGATVVNEQGRGGLPAFYRRMMTPILASRGRAKLLLWGVAVLFVVAALLPLLRLVPLKLLPFDNKNELQVVIDMPEGASLEHTAAIAGKVSARVRQFNEVKAVAAYVGVPSPIDFNGMVRHYYQRQAPHMADLRVTLVDKSERQHQSHSVVLRLRQHLSSMAADGVSIKVVEVPPGPPVLSTLVVEVYGSELTPYPEMQAAAATVMARLQREPFVVEVDSSVEAEHQRLRFITDKQKAALSGISTADINQALLMANYGVGAGFLQLEQEAKPLPLQVRLPPQQRTSVHDLQRLQVRGQPGIVKQSSNSGLEIAPQPLVALGELGSFQSLPADQTIQRKDLKPVVYVMAELSGRTPAEVIADINADLGQPAGGNSGENDLSDWQDRTFLNTFLGSGAGDGWQLPDDISIGWTGEGEWQITVDVFRDMGLAFLFALVGIFFVLKLQTSSTSLALIIMSAIPLTIIGIMPGFWLLNQIGERQVAGAPDPVLFTATAMIGMIALAGIVVRNSLIMVEFITQERERGASIPDALLHAGAIRMRPILLTAGTTLLGNLVITLDPVFSGLALAIIFGIVASTLFTLLVVPVVYLLVFDQTPPLRTDS
ncbi:efflux RND transporter permease subunit [Aestuariicella hydrocarbonica]|uniref:Efflux RND transporter permease subunit n=1 Tax=Pseudomaricurvus hydrocarbonicus TaxID=1470433 RepID=A0A9E5T3I4_9GAMM|nr:efflux RND transporter permease subunit [Aestuariicella hydrocarbonica]NHO67203.1 efflux RND transporter permease subunit [Aestuariicella hydrocarbonica]